MLNMAQAVANHNSKLLGEETGEDPVCNCKGGQQNCPVDGKCQTESIIYEVTVTEVISRKKETYTGQRLGDSKTDCMSTTLTSTIESTGLRMPLAHTLRIKGSNSS